MTVYLATNLTEGAAEPMDDERIETRWFTRDELAQAVARGEIIDGKTLIGYHSWLALEHRGSA